MVNELLLIHELAEKAQTTVRTIRYYTDEGLLPQPLIQGKFAYYNVNYLHRLELIRRMKDSYLPLREIRQILNSLSDNEVLLRLQEQAPAAQKTEVETAGRSGAKALDYISRLMNEQSAHRPQGTAVPTPPAQPRARIDQVPPAPGPAANLTSEETWQHIQLAQGVELHLRQPADPAAAAKLQDLIAFAKRLFA